MLCDTILPKELILMNKRNAAINTALIYIPLLIIFAISAYLGCYLGEAQWVYGVILMVLAIPVALFGSKCKPLYLLTVLMNGVGTGVIASYYFTYYSIPLTPTALITPTALAVAYVLILTAALHLSVRSAKFVCVLAGLLDVASLIALVVLWITVGGVFYPLTFFLFVLVGIGVVLFGIETSSEEEELLRDASYASFGVLITVGILVAILVGGDGCDCDAECCDCCDCSSGYSKKKRK